MNKILAKARRARKVRGRIAPLDIPRLTVSRSLCHIYAQIFSTDGARVLVTASTLDKEIAGKLKGKTGNISAASEVGKLLGKRAKKAGIVKIAFDRSGYRYHGRVKALAEAARAAGLEF